MFFYSESSVQLLTGFWLTRANLLPSFSSSMSSSHIGAFCLVSSGEEHSVLVMKHSTLMERHGGLDWTLTLVLLSVFIVLSLFSVPLNLVNNIQFPYCLPIYVTAMCVPVVIFLLWQIMSNWTVVLHWKANLVTMDAFSILEKFQQPSLQV